MSYLLQHSILDSAYRFPEKEAFKCGQQSLSFAQMTERMNQLAALLYRLGVRKGDRVGIYLNRCLETAVAMYGIMRAGAIYVPLDPRAPSSRTQFLIRDCGIEVILSHPSQKRKVATILEADLSLKAIIGIEIEASLESFSWGDLAMEDVTYQPPFPILEQDPAYIIYTSGSTGQPKGIMHSHYSGLSYAKLTADLYSINEK
ncbi:MAG: AMP-binding protein, partial [Bacteroidota bacterium]